jgi:hypothetical protein
MRKRSLFVIVLLIVAIAAVFARFEWMSSTARNDRAHAEAIRLRPKPYSACSHMIMLIDTAKSEWALEYRKTTNDSPPTLMDLRPYLGHGSNDEMPFCPCGGIYIPGRLDEHARCSLPPQEHTWDLWDRYSKGTKTNSPGNN